MGRLLPWLAVGWLMGCSVDGALSDWRDPPARYTVVRGDTLFVIAREHGVSVEELQAWNDLSGDRIEVGQVLVIRAHDATKPLDGAGRAKARPRATHEGSSEATADAPPSPEVVVGLDGTLWGTGAVHPPTSGAPPRHACLSGPTDVEGDEGIAAGMGLSPTQIRAVLGGFVKHTAACIPPGSSGSVTVSVDLTVGCDGRVSVAQVEDDGGAPERVARCIADTLAQAPFPAHDLPDGFSFRYPVTLSF